MSQTETETVANFTTRLRQKAVYCNFADTNEMIRDQVIEKCNSSRLRRKLLERGDVTLEQIQEIAQATENSDLQTKTMEDRKPEVNFVNKQSRTASKGNTREKGSNSMKCYACGRSDI
jgi:hypothetical protein